LRSALINIEIRRAARPLLLPLMSAGTSDSPAELGERAERLVTEHLGGSAEATGGLRSILARGGLDEEALAATALARSLDAVEQIERMLTSSERRRNQTLRDIEQHRLAVAHRTREVSDAIIEEVVVEAP
jgi:hypothetical protein